jgi:para-nitrobenzyl esterase
VATDAKFRIPHIRVAEAKIEGGGAPAYMYSFAWGYPDPIGTVRSPHGVDMPYFFDNLEVAPAANGPQAETLVKAMSGTLTALAHAGDPNHEALPLWPVYTLDRRSTLRFDVVPGVVDDPLLPTLAERG